MGDEKTECEAQSRTEQRFTGLSSDTRVTAARVETGQRLGTEFRQVYLEQTRPKSREW